MTNVQQDDASPSDLCQPPSTRSLAHLEWLIAGTRHSPVPMALIHGEPATIAMNMSFSVHLGILKETSELPVGRMPAWFTELLPRAIADGCQSGAVSYPDRPLDVVRDGQAHMAWFDLAFSPVFNEGGRCHAVLLTASETTEKILAVRAYARLQARHKLALEGQGVIGMWDLEVASGQVTADAQFAKLFDIPPDKAAAGVALERFVSFIDPQDKARVQAQIDQALANNGAFHSRYCILQGEGPLRWVAASGWPVFDKNGGAGHYTGIAIDVTEAAEASAALADSESRFRVLTETLPVIVWSSRTDGRHDYFNQRWHEFTGIAKKDVGPFTWKDLVHKDDQEQVFSHWAQCQKSGDLYDIAYRFRHHTGQYRWLRVMALPLRDSRGRMTHWFGTATDIHEGKMVAAQRELIAGELSHRLKNLFSLIQALIMLSSATSPEAKPYARQLASRFAALSRVYDVNRPPGDDAQSMMALMRRVLAPYEEPADTRIQIEGVDLEIDDVAANTFSLILHELATNAAKYGALSSPAGRVQISVELSKDRCLLSWKETGGPQPMSPDSRNLGFGSRLLITSVESQLGGEMHEHWEPDGLRFVADLPRSILRQGAM